MKFLQTNPPASRSPVTTYFCKKKTLAPLSSALATEKTFVRPGRNAGAVQPLSDAFHVGASNGARGFSSTLPCPAVLVNYDELFLLRCPALLR
jgi:hypothetical protein